MKPITALVRRSYARPCSVRAHAAAWVVYALAGLTVFATACAPARRPDVVPPPPARDEPRATPAAESWTFAYAAGAPTYTLRSASAIEVQDDTSQARDSVTMTLDVTFLLTDSAGRLRVAGTVDSFVVTSGGRVPATPNDTSGRLPGSPLLAFRGELGAAGLRLDPPAVALAANCDSPASALAAAVADLLPPIPRSLTPGHRWTDTTTSTVCRGDVPVTARAIHQYELRGPVRGIDQLDRVGILGAGSPVALSIARTSLVSLSGSGTPRGQAVTITGAGTSERNMVVEVSSGRLLSSTGRSVTSLTISNEIKSLRFEQRATTTMALARR